MSPSFFTDVFTVETWEQAKTREWTLTGFPPPTVTRGGYFQSTFDNVKLGDVLVCYVKAPAKRWVGALRVTGPMFIDYGDTLWGVDADGRARFPARIRVEPEFALNVDVGLPVEETLDVLKCMKGKHWSGLFRRSLVPIPPEDGETLLAMIPQPREPFPVLVPKGKVSKAAARAAGEAAGETPEIPGPKTAHPELVSKLIRLGKATGCDVWVAPGEKGQSFDGFIFKDETLKEFPPVGLDPESGGLVKHIDVIWARRSRRPSRWRYPRASTRACCG